MKTMPRILLRALYLLTQAMLTVIRVWEDRNADGADDYRMRRLTTGLWQASQSLRQIRDGEFEPMQRQLTWRVPRSTRLAKRYVDEMFRDTPVPLTPTEK